MVNMFAGRNRLVAIDRDTDVSGGLAVGSAEDMT